MPTPDSSTSQPPHSILVGVELREPGGEEVVATACAYAAALGAEVILAGTATLIEPVLGTGIAGMAEPLMPTAAQQDVYDRIAREQLDEVASTVPDGVPCRTMLGWGWLGPALVEMAETAGADLIALPIRHAGAIGHILHDGTDRYVLHHSPVPVLIVPA